MKNKAKKVISNGMRLKAEEALTMLEICTNGMFRLVKGLKIDSIEVEGRSDGKLCFSEKQRCRDWKDYMEWIMNEENYWDSDCNRDSVMGPVDCVCRGEVM